MNFSKNRNITNQFLFLHAITNLNLLWRDFFHKNSIGPTFKDKPFKLKKNL